MPVALFDRLLDEEISPRESVCRELARLFNARAPAHSEGLPALLAWGVPEWQGLNAGDDSALSEYCRRLRAAIFRHEPRIRALTVSVEQGTHQTLVLRLDATLWDDSTPLRLERLWQNGGWR